MKVLVMGNCITDKGVMVSPFTTDRDIEIVQNTVDKSGYDIIVNGDLRTSSIIINHGEVHVMGDVIVTGP